MKQKLLVITGPTASGKTGVAVEVALKLGGEVISADSMQVYSGMEIATAQPSFEEKRGVIHHMMGIFPPNTVCSAAMYRDMARGIIDDCFARGVQPIICGGTGLYINAITLPMAFGGFKGDEKIRGELSILTGAERSERLRLVDPETASRLHENDARRMIRALEIYYATGRTLTEHMASDARLSPPYDCTIFALTMPREALIERINARVDAMFEQGLSGEARLTIAGSTAMQAIGHKEILAMGEDAARVRIKIATAQYAKRQMTWLRRDNRVIRIDAARDKGVISRGIIEKFNGGEQ